MFKNTRNVITAILPFLHYVLLAIFISEASVTAAVTEAVVTTSM